MRAPIDGGATWDDFWALVPVDERDRDLVRAWMAFALFPTLPHPILVLQGSQGSCKTSIGTIISRLLDPGSVESIKTPTDSESWAASVSARWVLNVDNVSKVLPWWADDLCRTVTGSGVLRRQLYTDDDVIAQELRGAVILNGIPALTTGRPDLSERAVVIRLERPSEFRPAREITRLFEQLRPGLRDLVLKDVSSILRHKGTDRVAHMRMADFAEALSDLDADTGTQALLAFDRLLDRKRKDAIRSSPVAAAVLEFMRESSSWSGTCAELLESLAVVRDALMSNAVLPSDSDWPADAARLSGQLVACELLLEGEGIRVDRGQRKANARVISLSKTCVGCG